MIIDIHNHVYPDNIAQRAAEGIGVFYSLPVRHEGSLASLLASGDKSGVSVQMICSAATKPSQIDSIHGFLKGICDSHRGRIYAFGALHPDCANPDAIIGKIIENGFLGVKLHPDIQGFSTDDRRAYPMYEAMQGRLPLLIHAGDNRHFLSDPRKIARIAADFPRLTLICAHLGGWSQWDEAELLTGKNIYVDTSSSLYRLEPSRAARLIRAFGVERTMFGTDYPMWDAGEELERLQALELTGEETDWILSKTAMSLFGIT